MKAPDATLGLALQVIILPLQVVIKTQLAQLQELPDGEEDNRERRYPLTNTMIQKQRKMTKYYIVLARQMSVSSMLTFFINQIFHPFPFTDYPCSLPEADAPCSLSFTALKTNIYAV